jgi:hypothetical protein
MANFASQLKDNLSSVADPNQIINRGVDKNRTLFLKGLTSTTSGQKEDPTYLGFRIMFDMGIGGLVDPETYLPISPLFSSGTTSVTNNLAMKIPSSSVDFFHASKLGDVPNYTEAYQYMTAEGFLRQRRTLNENGTDGTVRRDASGQVLNPGVNESFNDLGQKTAGVAHRASALLAFKNILTSINEKSPWFIQSIDGLDQILKVNIPRQGGPGGAYREQRSGVLTLECLDSIDLRVNAMAELYRKATYDYEYHRDLLPSNLKKFRMWIIVTEIRQIDLQKNLGDSLNPFNISGVGSAFDNIKNIAQGAGILKDKEQKNDADKPGRDLETFVKSFEKLTPYIMMYQLDLCEFNFDESYPFSKLSNASNTTPVSSKFKIHVGKAKEYKLQYNILSDLLKNESVFAPILIQDSWNLSGSKLAFTPDLSNNVNLFSKLANNFINNSIASVVQQQVSPIVTSKLLGNAYGFRLSDAVRSLNSGQDLLRGVENIRSPFDDTRPQSQGLGGPGQRQYPTLKTDVYPTVPETPGGGLGNVFPPQLPVNPLAPNDAYPTNPGVDSGLPNRQYPVNTGDEYAGVPGEDLGAPGRVYPSNAGGDLYTTNPGQDLGLPDRQYPTNSDDLYGDVPGSDLGVPGRVYPASVAPNPDSYPTNPGPDLGLPSRLYPTNTDDEYSGVPGGDLGLPGRVYPDSIVPEPDVYLTNPGPDLGLPNRVYPDNRIDEYDGVPGRDLGAPGRIYPEDPGPNPDVYPTNPNPDLGLPSRMYPENNSDLYDGVPGKDLGVPGRVYSDNMAPDPDIYPTNPGPDLGVKDRVYPSNLFDEYSDVPGKDLGAPERVYKKPENIPDAPADVYPTNPENLEYPNIESDLYSDVPGKDLGGIERVYKNPDQPTDIYKGVPENLNYQGISKNEYNIDNNKKDIDDLGNVLIPSNLKIDPDNDRDKYDEVPGKDLGVPRREYKSKIDEPLSDVYPGIRDQGLPDRIYPDNKTAPDQYPNSPGPDLGVPYVESLSKDSPMVSDPSLTQIGLPQRRYPTIKANVYGRDDVENTLRTTKKSYPRVNSDEYPTVPGKDLGVPNISFALDEKDKPLIDPSIGDKISDLSKPQRVYPNKIDGQNDVYPNHPVNKLELEKMYPGVRTDPDSYREVSGENLGAPDRVYVKVNDDVYTENPGEDLGLPKRGYLRNNDNEYEFSRSRQNDLFDPSLNDNVYLAAERNNKEEFKEILNDIDQYPTVPQQTLDNPGVSDNVYDDLNGSNKQFYPQELNALDEYPTVPQQTLENPGVSDNVYDGPAQQNSQNFKQNLNGIDQYPSVPQQTLENPGVSDNVYDGAQQVNSRYFNEKMNSIDEYSTVPENNTQNRSINDNVYRRVYK